MKTKVKKVLSLLLATVMAFSMFTVIGAAASVSDENCITLVFDCRDYEMGKIYWGTPSIIEVGSMRGFVVLRSNYCTPGNSVQLPELKKVRNGRVGGWVISDAKADGATNGEVYACGSEYTIPVEARMGEYIVFAATDIDKDACLHSSEFHVEHAEEPATCVIDGHTAGVFCTECNKWISGHDTIRAHHVDSDGNGICDICGEPAINVIDTGIFGNNIVWTFYDTGLLNISGSGEMYESPNDKSFTWNSIPWLKYSSSIKNVNIEEGITSICSYAFRKCTALTSINIAQSVTSIGNLAFVGCSALPTVKLPDNLTVLGESAFSDCVSLTDITIPSQLREIEWNTFASCTALKNVVLPDGLVVIGEGAFEGCSGLNNIKIPNNVTTIGEAAFYGCALSSVRLSYNVESIGGQAFGYLHGDKNETFVIYGYVNTAAENYADNNGFSFYSACTHSEDAYVTKEAVKETCTTDGYTEGIYCNECQAWVAGHKLIEAHHVDENDDAICDICSEQTEQIIKVGETLNVSVEAGETAYFRFIPEVSGKYTFKSMSEKDTYGYLFDADKYEITNNDDFNDGNFSITYDLVAGTKYYFGARLYSRYKSGSFYVQLTLDEAFCPHEHTSFHEENLDATCTVPGYTAGTYCEDCKRWIEGHEEIWLDHVDADGNGVCDVCNEITEYTLKADETKTVKVDAGTTTYLRFIPKQSGKYVFKAYPDSEIVGYFLDSDKEIIEIDYGYIDEYLYFSVELTAGTRYYFGVKYYDEDRAGSFDVSLELREIYCKHTTTETVATVEPTCKANGYTEGVRCTTCGKYISGHELIAARHTDVDGNGVCDICSQTVCEIVYSGTAGADITWSLDKNGTLTLIGSGEMMKYEDDTDDDDEYEGGWHNRSDMPWYEYSETIKNIVVGDGITSVCVNAFNDCDNLKSVTLGNSVELIGYSAFRSCESLTSIVIPDSVRKIDEEAFCYCYNLESVTLGNSVTNIGYEAFCDCGNLTEIVIPDSVKTIGGYAFEDCYNLESVTFGNSLEEIGYRAFSYCEKLTSVVIPDSVKTIGSGAFCSCYKLKDINVAENNTAYSSVDGVLFDKNKTTLVVYPAGKNATEYTVPDTVKTIKDQAFDNCDNLANVTLNDGLESIGYEAFNSCDNLKSIVIPDSVTYIDGYAFEWCDSLESVTLGSGIEYIKYKTFYYCLSLKNVVIPDSVEKIENSAFRGCSKLESITLPNKLKEIEYNAFQYSGLKSISFPDSLTVIGEAAFENCDNLTSVTIGSGVKTVTKYAFRFCNNLESVIIPANVDMVGYKAFESCPKLKSVTIEDGVRSIRGKVFWKCPELKSVTIPSSVTTILEEAFGYLNEGEKADDFIIYGDTGSKAESYANENGFTFYQICRHGAESLVQKAQVSETCTENGYTAGVYCNVCERYISGYELIKSHHFDENDDEICDVCGNDAYNIVDSGDCGENVTWTLDDEGTLRVRGSGDMGTYKQKKVPWYSHRKEIKKAVIKDGVTSIGQYAFYDYNNLTEVTIGNSVTNIGYEAFYDCGNLTEIVIPDSVKTIGEYAFYRCYNLENVRLGNSLEEIGDSAFRSCYSLTNVVIPDSVKIIGGYAFEGCDNLESVTFGNSLEEIGWDAFGYCSKLTNLTFGNNLKTIRSNAFEYCDSLTNVVIPASVTVIEERAFACCKKLTDIDVVDGNTTYCSVDGVLFNKDKTTLISYPIGKSETEYTIPDGVKRIDNSAFYRCSNLTNVVIPDNVTYIGNNTFDGCGNLTEIVIPGSVETIGTYAFYSCDNLENVTIEDGVKYISNGAFAYCYKLTSISIPGSVKKIGYEAFRRCNSLTNVEIAEGVESIGYEAFYNCKNLESVTIPASVQKIGSHAFGFYYYEYEDDDGYYENDYEKVENFTIKGYTGEAKTYAEKYGFNFVNLCDSHDSSVHIQYPEVPATCKAFGFTAGVYCTVSKQWISGHELTEPKHNDADGDGICDTCGNSADSSITFGKCGETVYYTLDSEGTLTISGSGDMMEYARSYDEDYDYDGYYYDDIPWYENRDSIKKVIISDGITSICDYAFYHCSNLTEVIIPDSVTEIGYEAFRDCDGLTKIVIPDSVKTIGNDAFCWCYNLENVTLGNSLEEIGRDAFQNCDNLTEIVIPASVKTIGGGAFSHCDKLTNITVAEGNENFVSVDSIIFSKDKTTLLAYPLAKTDNTYVIPNSVKTIGDSAFYGCGHLKNVTFGNSLEEIGDSAFKSCDSLTNVVIPDSVKTIAEEAFEYCNSLTSVTIGSGVESIGYRAFYGCSSLKKVYIPSTVKEIGEYAFGYSSYWNEEIYNDFIIECERNSAAEIYAKENNIGYAWACHHSADKFTYGEEVAETCTTNGYTGGVYCNECQRWIINRKVVTAHHVDNDSNGICDKCSEKYIFCIKTGVSIGEYFAAGAKKKYMFIPEYSGTYEFVGDTNYESDVIMTIYDSEMNNISCDYISDYSIEADLEACKIYYIEVKFRDGDASGNITTEVYSVSQNNNCNHDEVTDEKVDPTCTKAGLSEGSHCKLCGKVLVAQETIQAKGHNYGDWNITKNATCIEKGEKSRKCVDCDNTEYAAIAMTRHNYSSDWTVDVEATCKTTGTKSHHCTVCNAKTDITVIPVTNHAEVTDPAVAATCTTDGKTEGKHCSVCGTVIVAQTTIPAHHTEVTDPAVAATCTTDGKTEGKHCSVCGTVIVAQTTIPAHHTEVIDKAVAPTCLSTGLTEGKHCSVCNAVLVKQEVLGKVDHSYGSWTKDKAATCTEAGKQVRTCSVCDAKEYVELAALGHNYNTDWTVDLEPTCTVNGSKSKHCKRCDDKKDVTEILATGHTEVTDEGKAATCTEDGKTEGKHCSTCNEILVKQEVIKAIGHTPEEIPEIPATCKSEGATSGKKCSVCGDIIEKPTTTPINANNHASSETYVKNDKTATCYAEGYSGDTYHSCCDTLVSNGTIIPKIAHTPGDAVKENIVKASCTNNGSYDSVVYCSVEECKAEISRTETPIASREHHMGDWTVSIPATYTSEGVDIRYCTNTEASELYEACEYSETQPSAKLTDSSAPTGTIGYGTSLWDKLLETITFGTYISDDVTVEITAEDKETGVEKIEYYISDKALTVAELNNIADWNVYTDKFTITKADSESKVIYAKLTNKQNGFGYISTNGFTFDITAPVIDVETSCAKATVTVNEINVDSVTVNGQKSELDANGKCAVSGVGEYTVIVTDKAGNTSTKNFELKGHTEVTDEGFAPTCTTEGKSDGKHCSVCGEVTKAQTKINALGHKEEIFEEAVEATCTKNGSTAGIKCSVCNTTLSEPTVINAKGHTEVVDKAVAATCTAAGKTEGKHCSVCGTVTVAQTTVPAKGHKNVAIKAVAATCTKNGSTAGTKCSVCGTVTKATTVVKAKGHSYKTTTTKATTSKNGSTVTKCTVCGNVKSTVTIAKIKSVKLSKTSLTYNGKTQKPTVTVKDNKGKTLKNGTDYTVKYSKGCKKTGQYTVTVTFKGNYSGTKTLTFKIVPKGTSVSKLSAGKKQFKVEWKKQTSQTTGYEIQYSTSSKMKNAKTVTVGKNKTISTTVKNLKSGKKYYVRIRTYKTVKINGKSVKLYSSWSSVKNVKTK